MNGVLTHTWTWTEQTIANNVAPDDDEELGIGGADRVFFQWDTNGADTGSPDFDFHVYASGDGNTWTTAPYKTLASAVAKDVVGNTNFTEAEIGPSMIRVRLDVNTANLVATEYVTLTVRVYY